MKTAIFAGSFDPPTYGHLDIIRRGSSLFDKLIVVVAINSAKKYLFSDQERIDLLEEMVKPFGNVSVEPCSSLIVNFAKEHDANVLLRGVRNSADFSYEFDLAMMNKGLAPDMETVFLPTSPEYFVVRSSGIKEMAAFGGDVSKMVPPVVEEALKKKYK
ncbi:MAG: pantetheine-phosphate adenylyltransferase [Treponemataceae bacterium]|nr:pantetheine-phosphate adenylyltransferase [Treponemataceae bacterium]